MALHEWTCYFSLLCNKKRIELGCDVASYQQICFKYLNIYYIYYCYQIYHFYILKFIITFQNIKGKLIIKN